MVLGGLLDGGLEESDLESNLTVSMQSALQAWLQDTGASVTVNSVAADSESAVRRAGGGAVSVDATVEGGGSLLLLTLEEGAVDMGGGSSVLSMEAQAVGVCGNGVCESVGALHPHAACSRLHNTCEPKMRPAVTTVVRTESVLGVDGVCCRGSAATKGQRTAAGRIVPTACSPAAVPSSTPREFAWTRLSL